MYHQIHRLQSSGWTAHQCVKKIFLRISFPCPLTGPFDTDSVPIVGAATDKGHTILIDAGGAVYAWGLNNMRQEEEGWGRGKGEGTNYLWSRLLGWVPMSILHISGDVGPFWGERIEPFVVYISSLLLWLKKTLSSTHTKMEF